MRLETLLSLVECLPAYGNRPALGLRRELGLRWWSYQRLYDETYRAAALLRNLDIRPGARVLLWAPNCPEWAAFLLGAALRGAVVVPVDENASSGAVRRLAKEVKAALLLHGPLQDAAAIALPALSIYDLSRGHLPSTGEDLVVPVKPDDPAAIIYTSGTTARPRGVILTHRNLAAQAERFRRFRLLVRVIPTRMLMLSPLSHAQGLLLGICVPLFVGASVIYSESIDPAHVIRTIKQNRVTLLVAVPRLQHLLATALQQLPSGQPGVTLWERAHGIRFRPYRRRILFRGTRAVLGYQFWALLVGGATLSLEDQYFWHECRCFLAHGYGLTETAAIVSFNLNTPFVRPKGSIGRPLANQTVRVAGDGELLVRGPSVTPGYLGGNVPDTEVFVDGDGFLHTGDLVQRDAKGRLYFQGRKKEVVVTAEGHNVSPHEVEAELKRLPGVRDAAVVGLDREGYEEVHAALLLERGAQPGALVQQANAGLEPHQRIRSWSVWPGADFPRTTLGKVQRVEVAAAVRKLQAELSSGAPGLAPLPSLETILAIPDRHERVQQIARYLVETPHEELASRNLHLVHDLGLSSLDVVALLSLVEQSGRVVWKEAVVPENSTLADLHTMMSSPEPYGEAPAIYTRSPVAMDHPLVRLPRALLAPMVWSACVALRTRLAVRGLEHLAGVRPPVIVVGAHHKDWCDGMTLYRSLPRHLRRRLLLITTEGIFLEWEGSTSQPPLAHRILVSTAFHAGPFFFAFALWPRFGTTREGLFETCRLIDRGFSPIMFPEPELRDDGEVIEPGIGLLAAQTQMPILPVRLEGNSGIRYRPWRRRKEVSVYFGEPITMTPDTTAEQATQLVREAFRSLRQATTLEP